MPRTKRRPSVDRLLELVDITAGRELFAAEAALLRSGINSLAGARDSAAGLQAKVKELREELRELQQRPTKWVYDQAAEALWRHRERAEHLAAALDDVLRHFVHETHPGRACLQSGHVDVATVAKWRQVLADSAPTTPAVVRPDAEQQAGGTQTAGERMKAMLADAGFSTSTQASEQPTVDENRSTCTATLQGPRNGSWLLHCAQIAGHYDEARKPQVEPNEDGTMHPGGWHYAPVGECCWADWANGATPHRAPSAGGERPGEAVVLAARHLDLTEGPLGLPGHALDNADLSAIRTVTRYIAEQHRRGGEQQ
jgi:hypothetical protein